MTMEQPELNAIRHAAFGVAGYAELTAEQLAAIVSQPAAMRSGELQTVLGEALAAGATAADFATVWQYPEWLTRLESALGSGDYAGITILLNTAPFDWSMETDAAVTAVVTARALNAAQAKAIEQGADPDLLGTITAQDVTDALAL